MRPATLVLLALVVVGLALALRQRARRLVDPDRPAYDHALLEGLDPGKVSALRIEHLDRGDQVTLERDDRGTWYLTDPVAYPAEHAFVAQILTDLARARGPLEPSPDLAALGLAPPSIVLEVTEGSGAGARTRRVELGGIDVDPRLVLARVPGHPAAGEERAAVLRVTRSLHTALDHHSDTYRQARITPVRGDRVVSLRRRGAVRLEGEGLVDLDLDALLEPGGWRRVDPPRVALQPVAVGLLARAAAEMRAEKFVDDSPADLAPYGLDAPAIRVEIEDDLGQSAALRVGFPAQDADLPFESRRWVALREGSPHVFAVGWRGARTLAQPAHLLYDDQILRAFRADVLSVELEAGGRSVALARETGRWWVSTGGGRRFPAEEARVEDVLATLEQARLGDYPPGIAFEPEDPPRRLRIVTSGDVVWGGELGGPGKDPATGAVGVVFRRFGDDVAGLVEERVARLTEVDPESLRERDVHDVPEREVAGLSLRLGERTLAYVHREDDWYPQGVALAVPPRVGALFERLLHPVALEWLDPETAEPLADACEVVLSGPSIGTLRFTIGRAGERVECRTPDGRRALLRSGDEILDGLLELLGP